MVIPVILCGGSGTRLWPLSRAHYPKQFLSLAGESGRSLLQGTVLRAARLEGAGPPLIITHQDHRFLVAEQLREMEAAPEAILLEPMARNTAPAAAVASLWALERHPDALLLILPSDHIVRDEAAFTQAVEAGVAPARSGGLVTFGIVPTRPETGYGYIKAGEPLEGKSGPDGRGPFRIERFVEKPDRETAARYLESGRYLWNSGMFLFRPDAYLDELGRFHPEMLQWCRKAVEGLTADLDFHRIPSDAFQSCPSGSMDEVVMERTRRGVVVPAGFPWSDVGSWAALWEVAERDDRGNAVKGDCLLLDTADSYIHSTGRLVAALGLRGHVVVETADAVLVAPKERVQEVKEVVRRLRAAGRREVEHHRKVYRPWGSYEELSLGPRFQVKHIVVKPGAALSLQMHHHRAEHWVVVRGTARITRGDETFLLTENQSTYIPLGVKHRLENPGIIPLELIEVQSGPYLGEDDIVRFDDHYGRSGGGDGQG